MTMSLCCLAPRARRPVRFSGSVLFLILVSSCVVDRTPSRERSPRSNNSSQTTVVVTNQRTTSLDGNWFPDRWDDDTESVEATFKTDRRSGSAEVERISTGLESTKSRIVVTTDNHGPRTIVDEVVNVGAISWSPDGDWLAFCEGTLVSVVNRNGGGRQLLYAGPGGPYPGACRELFWSVDGGELSFIQLEHAGDPSLANPSRIVLTLEEKEAESR
jgi:hypothetical protein